MAEFSKTVGEHGEEAARNFFNIIGWNNLIDGKDITCRHPKNHKLPASKNGRTKHGVDLMFSYLCPFEPTTRKQFLISVKNQHSDEKEGRSRTASKIKQDLTDLNTALKCYQYSDLRKSYMKQGRANNSEQIGLLLYLDENLATPLKRDSSISVSAFPNEGNYTHIVIDSQRFDFIEALHHYLHFAYTNHEKQYYIYNSSPDHLGSLVTFLPFSYLSGGSIPIAISLQKGDQTIRTLLIFSEANFSTTNLPQLLSLSLKLTQEWADCIILFPDYNRIKHEADAKRIIQEMKDISNIKIKCDSYSLKTRGR